MILSKSKFITYLLSATIFSSITISIIHNRSTILAQTQSGSSSQSNQFGAIAIGNKGCKRFYGWSWQYSSLQDAIKIALKNCQESNCKAFGGKNGFTVLVIDNQLGWGIGTDYSQDNAQYKAIRFCQQTSTNPNSCHVILIVNHRQGTVLNQIK